MNDNLQLTDINPLEHITGDIAISQYNYESIMNGLVQWNMSKLDNITIRVATRTDPYFVDYVIPTKYFYDRTYGDIASEPGLPGDHYAYNNRSQFGVAKDDKIVVRVSVPNNGGTAWMLYKDITVYDEYVKEEVTDVASDYILRPNSTYKHSYIPGLYIRGYDTGTHKFNLYKTNSIISENDPTYQNTNPVVYEANHDTIPMNRACEIIIDVVKGDVYAIKAGYEVPTESFNLRTSNLYIKIGTVYKTDENLTYTKGDLVYFNGNFYVCKVDTTILPPAVNDAGYDADAWSFNTDVWDEVLLLPLNMTTITDTVNFRLNADTDISGIVLRNVGGIESGDATRITISTSISYPGETTKQPTGLDVIPTCNYVNWPRNDANKWEAGGTYSTDVAKDAYCKQDYSAVMVFSHLDADVRYKNIINYDGPDLDQGLCILLPVTAYDTSNHMHDPVDGCMFEFMFNIWPNHDYDRHDTNDLIINKSQIYVYSVSDMNSYETNGFSNGTVEPIAKFSMARVMNYYVESENIGVPDRPVCYKARFIYSQAEHRWKTYDYYQLPDHVFMTPHGFVDPSTQESAGFPLYQNPFSDYDLSAIRMSGPIRNQYQYQMDEE